jgi:hypothetical protein
VNAPAVNADTVTEAQGGNANGNAGKIEEGLYNASDETGTVPENQMVSVVEFLRAEHYVATCMHAHMTKNRHNPPHERSKRVAIGILITSKNRLLFYQ